MRHQRLEALGLELVNLFGREPLGLPEFIEGADEWFAVPFPVYAQGVGVQQQILQEARGSIVYSLKPTHCFPYPFQE